MYILYIIVLKIKLITNLHALSVAIHVHSNNRITGGLSGNRLPRGFFDIHLLADRYLAQADGVHLLRYCAGHTIMMWQAFVGE